MASASTIPTMDPWKPRRTRRFKYQSHAYKLISPAECAENSSDPSSDNRQPQPPPRTLNRSRRNTTERGTLNPTSRIEKKGKNTLLETEDVLIRDPGSYLQNISVQTMSSPSEDRQNLTTADLAMTDQEHSKRKLITTPCPPSSKQVRKRQTRSRRQTSARKGHTIAQKPEQPTAKCNSAVHSSQPVTVKLWEPHNIVRERRHLNELDVCLSVYDQVMKDAIDKERRPFIKEILLKHVKTTQKTFLAIIKQTHMLQLVQKRYQMEKTRQKKLQRAMQSTFKDLRKGANKLLIKREYVQRSKGKLQLTDSDKETEEDMFKQLKSFLAPFDTQGILVPENQSLSE